MQLATSSCLPAVARNLSNCRLRLHFFKFFDLFIKQLVLWGKGQQFWENGCAVLPFFEPCPYTWKGEIFHSSWSLEISFFSLKLEKTWTFISTVGIIVLWKSEFAKNSSRIAGVMEIFCTLLQCKVHLSMFHSSPTSKIWYTSA
jgi:hypothetical protein